MVYCFYLEAERIAWIPVTATKENVQDDEFWEHLFIAPMAALLSNTVIIQERRYY
jgi:hypothetical protein